MSLQGKYKMHSLKGKMVVIDKEINYGLVKTQNKQKWTGVGYQDYL